MNEAQRAYYEKLRQFKKAPEPTAPVPVVYTGGQYRWSWKCAGCKAPCIGEPIVREGNKWFCYCKGGELSTFPQAR